MPYDIPPALQELTLGRFTPIPKLLLGHFELVIRMPKHPLRPPRRVEETLGSTWGCSTLTAVVAVTITSIMRM